MWNLKIGASEVSRRSLLSGGGALVIGVVLAPRGIFGKAAAQAGPPRTNPDAFIRIAPDNSITVLVKHLEFGQGPLTGLTTLVAEELDADWSQMRAEEAPADAELYGNFLLGQIQGTGGSTAIANSYDQMRKAGAAAREMLIAAAAAQWRVPAAEISTKSGMLSHASSGKSAAYGAFADAASKLPAPSSPKLKDPANFRFIGKEGVVKKLDVPDKTTGKTVFSIDVFEPEMLTVVVAHPPRFNATPRSVDDAAARGISGVSDVKMLSTGVAVYAADMWSALKGRKALKVEWDGSKAETRDSDQIFEALAAKASTPGVVAGEHGDVDAALRGDVKLIEAEYRFPYLAHAPMEPRDGAMIFDGTRVKARYGCQIQTADQNQIAKIFGVPVANVEIETLLAGGSFGRRGDLGGDQLGELCEATKAIGPNRWVKLVWTREDDIGGGFYRPIVVHKIRAGLAGGKIVAWSDTIASPSIGKGTSFEPAMLKDGIDKTMVEGAKEIPYDIPHFRCDAHIVDGGPRVLFWRSVGSTHTAYVVETFIDELLATLGKDPVQGRLDLMGNSPREAGVLAAVADMADWNSAPPPGRARGVALAKAFNTYVAEIAEVSLAANGEPRVHMVWCAVDCGVAVNPDIIRAQMEGGIGYGLGHILYGQVRLKDGAPIERNFDAYRSLRIHEMPDVKVRIIQSTEHPTGVGEPGVPPIGPAVANAIAKLTGQRVRNPPIFKGVA
jgi:isoquinoline 1-oxidoreductase beta subunit